MKTIYYPKGCSTIKTDDWETHTGILFLFYDYLSGVAWFWLPPSVRPTKLAIRNSDPQQFEADSYTPLLEISPHNIVEGLCFAPVATPIVPLVESLCDRAHEASDGEIPPPPQEESLLALLSEINKSYAQTAVLRSSLLRLIVEAAAYDWDQVGAPGGLQKWLSETSPDHLSLLREPEKTIPRDPALFSALLEAAKSRKIVGLAGGLKSGLSTFMEQFSVYLDRNPQVRTYKAEFHPSEWKSIHDHRMHIRASRGYSSSEDTLLELKTLLASLAYSAYLEVRKDTPTINAAKLNEFTDGDAQGKPAYFSDTYFRLFGRATAKPVIIAHFIRFLSLLLKKSGTPKDLAVLMPFRQLTGLLFSAGNRTIDAAAPEESVIEDAALHLNTALQDFASEEEDKPQENRIALIFATKQLGRFIQDHSLFAKTSILTLPPFSEKEIQFGLARLFRRRRIEAHPLTDLASKVRSWTTGAPWFVATLLRVFDEKLAAGGGTSGDYAGKCLDEAKDLLVGALEGNPVKVDNYLQREIRMLRQDTKTLMQPFSAGEDNRIELVWLHPEGPRIAFDAQRFSPRIGRWLEGGLVWLKSQRPGAASQLASVASYPHLFPHPAGALQKALWKSIVENRDPVEVPSAQGTRARRRGGL